VVTIVEAADDVPERLPRSGVALVGSHDRRQWLVLDCPCAARHRIFLNLELSRYPCWQVPDEGKLTVAPSVDAHVADRHCHYFIRRGRVVWVREKEI
jgi:hypothetical protein